MNKIILINGWASDRRVWKQVAPMLQTGNFHIEYFDMGYTGTPNTDIDIADCVVVVHSLGLIHCYNHIKNTGQRPKKIISLSGFTRFSQSDDFTGVRVRILQRMTRALQLDMNACLTDFHTTANSLNIFDNVIWNSKLIMQGMDNLINMDVRKIRAELAIAEANLWGDEDKIVSQQMTEQSFTNYEILKNCGHFVQLEMPKQCGEFILKNAE